MYNNHMNFYDFFQLRELYCIAMKKHIIEDKSFKTCLQLLKFLSKEDLLKKFNEVICILLLYLIF